jgi:long-chain acyl-CoA synthetase
MGVQVGQILRQAALRAPERVGLVAIDHAAQTRRELSYGALDCLARTVAARLLAHGLGRGERVGLLADNSEHFVAAWFGIVYAGGAVVPMAVSSAVPELRYRLSHAFCRVLIHDAARTLSATESCKEPTLTVQPWLLSELCEPGLEPLAHPVDTSPEDTALVLYTSGTTGKAKGAAISHASLMLHTLGLVHHSLQLSAEDVVLCTLPLTHSFGCRMALLAPLFAQSRIVMVSRFSARHTLTLMQTESVSWLPAVPTMFAAWAEVPGEQRPACLRWALSAGAPLPDEIARRAGARLGTEVRQGYGMTEATFCTINAPPDACVLGSVGKPAWGVEVRVVDEAGHDVPQGETGEVVVRGHNLMTHYLFDPQATLEVAPDGFLRSGDVGKLDAQGRLYIVDRRKDLILRGGFNVYPSEVEDVLAAHEAVAQVAVIGKAHAFYGEEVVAVVVARTAANASVRALQDWAAERMSQTKWPRHYAFVAALPLGPSGKVQKRVLRQWLAEGKLTLQDVVTQDAAAASATQGRSEP